jgi:pimeloyl-ACP methyl ester carboxylesterase
VSAEPALPTGTELPARWWGNHLGELRWQAEAVRLLADPVFRGDGVPVGDGRAVVLLPGFLAGDYTLAVMARWLQRIGYRPHTSGMLANVDCSAHALARVEVAVTAARDATGRRVAVLGHSRGGHLARAVAVKRPDAVSHAISLGAALRDQLDISIPTRAAVSLVQRVHKRRSPERRDCFTGSCACAFGTALAAPLPQDVRLTSIYSRGDGVVWWGSCMAPDATNVEITGSHVGLAFNRKAYRAIAEALAVAEIPAAA